MNNAKPSLYRGRRNNLVADQARRELEKLEPTKLGNHRALHQRKDGLIVEIVVPGRDEDEIE